jgi:hypothetical protein
VLSSPLKQAADLLAATVAEIFVVDSARTELVCQEAELEPLICAIIMEFLTATASRRLPVAVLEEAVLRESSNMEN